MIEWLEHETHQSPQSTAVVKNEGNYISNFPYTFMDNFTIYIHCEFVTDVSSASYS